MKVITGEPGIRQVLGTNGAGHVALLSQPQGEHTMSEKIDQLHVVGDEAEDSDEGFADCAEGAHEGCDGPWWHKLSLEERAEHAEGGPWWAEEAAAALGNTAGQEAEVESHGEICEGCVKARQDVVQDAFELILDLQDAISEGLTPIARLPRMATHPEVVGSPSPPKP
jgi:hypothetical protein